MVIFLIKVDLYDIYEFIKFIEIIIRRYLLWLAFLKRKWLTQLTIHIRTTNSTIFK